MKKIFLIAVLALAPAAVFAAAQGGAAPAKKATSAAAEKRDSALDKVDAIDREIMDLDVKQWAWRVTTVKDVTYDQLRDYSKRWVMKEDTKQVFLSKLADKLKKGVTARPSDEEMARLNAAKARQRAILAPGSTDETMIASLTEDYCVALEGRYWALRVQNGEKDILEKMEHWTGGAYMDKVRGRIRADLAEKNAALSADEAYRMDGCGAKFKQR